MIASIENAIVERLKRAGEAEVLGYRFRTAEAHPRNWEERLVSSQVNYPAAWCSFVRFTGPEPMRSGVSVVAVFELVVGAKNMRNLAASRHGAVDGSEVGVLQLMADAIGLLQGQTLGLEIKGLSLTGGELAADLPESAIKAGIALAVMQFTTRFTFDAATPFFAPTDEFIGEFATFATDWMAPATDQGSEEPALSTLLSVPISDTQPEEA